MNVAFYIPELPDEIERILYTRSLIKAFVALNWQVDILAGKTISESTFENFGTVIPVELPNFSEPLAPPSLKRLRQVSELGQELSKSYNLFISLESPVPLFNNGKQGGWIPPFPSPTKPQSVTGATGFFSKLKQSWYNRLEWNSRFTKYRNIFVPSKYMQKCFYERYKLWSTVLEPEITLPCSMMPPEQKSKDVCLMTNSDSDRQFLSSQFDRLVKNTNISSKLFFVSPSDSFENIINTINSCSMFWDASEFMMIRSEMREARSERNSVSQLATRNSQLSAFPTFSAYAMAMGTIPITYCAGAASEVIIHQQSGFLWKEVTEALGYLFRLVQDDQLRHDYAILAQTRAKFYSTDLFRKRLKSILVLR